MERISADICHQITDLGVGKTTREIADGIKGAEGCEGEYNNAVKSVLIKGYTACDICKQNDNRSKNESREQPIERDVPTADQHAEIY